MILVIALTQFAFLALGIVALKIMTHATGSTLTPDRLETFSQYSLLLFAVPLVWVAFASVCIRVERIPLTTRSRAPLESWSPSCAFSFSCP